MIAGGSLSKDKVKDLEAIITWADGPVRCSRFRERPGRSGERLTLWLAKYQKSI